MLSSYEETFKQDLDQGKSIKWAKVAYCYL